MEEIEGLGSHFKAYLNIKFYNSIKNTFACQKQVFLVKSKKIYTELSYTSNKNVNSKR